MPRIGLPELIVILVIALVFFGPGKLPSVGASIGKAISEFKKSSSEAAKEVNEVKNTEVEKEEKKS